MPRSTKALIGGLIFLFILGFAGRGDYEAELAQDLFYEKMVCAGAWPDYKNLAPECT